MYRSGNVYQELDALAIDIYVDYGINSFPLDEKELCRKMGILLIPYSSYEGKENKHYFREGLEAMLECLEPEVVLVYGAMPDSVFAPSRDATQFIHYPDWISEKRKKVG